MPNINHPSVPEHSIWRTWSNVRSFRFYGHYGRYYAHNLRIFGHYNPYSRTRKIPPAKSGGQFFRFDKIFSRGASIPYVARHGQEQTPPSLMTKSFPKHQKSPGTAEGSAGILGRIISKPILLRCNSNF